MNETKRRKNFRQAAKLIVRARKAHGTKYIVLGDVYNTLNAQPGVEQNGVLWAMAQLKAEGEIMATEERGVYYVLRDKD